MSLIPSAIVQGRLLRVEQLSRGGGQVAESQSKSGIPSGTIVEREIVADASIVPL